MKMEKIELLLPNSTYTFNVAEQETGLRLDVYLANRFPSYSRSFFNKLISRSFVLVNSEPALKKSITLKVNDKVAITFPMLKKFNFDSKLVESLDVQIVHEHQHFLIINKPANLIVHSPNSSSESITLVDWLLAHFNDIKDVGYEDRPGIVHRIDKDTTGLLIIPRNNCAHAFFGNLFKERKIKKTYLAIVEGHPQREGIIDFPIMRHPYNKSRMVHVSVSPYLNNSKQVRQALTNYKVLEYFDDCSLVEVYPFTGRTHQIRVHLAAIGCPIIGDQVYGTKSKLISRQALHACKLGFEYDGNSYNFFQDMPGDFKKILISLQKMK